MSINSTNPAFRNLHWSLVCAVLLILSGCTSSLVVKSLYADLDERSADRFKEYANFNERQSNWIDNRATRFHRWHRATQLPLYAEALKTLSSQLEGQATLNTDAIQSWEETIRELTDNIRSCHPLNEAHDFLVGLSDVQVKQIDSHMREQHQKFRKRYESESDQDRLERRMENITKWAGRLGAGFNPQQRALLEQTLKAQHSLGEQRMQLRRDWLARFNANLQRRKTPEFADNLNMLLEQQWRQTERDYPEQWQQNELLWSNFLQEFLRLQSEAQRNTMLVKINKFAGIIASMSKQSTSTTTECA